jgi:hypothetical protein
MARIEATNDHEFGMLCFEFIRVHSCAFVCIRVHSWQKSLNLNCHELQRKGVVLVTDS